MKQQSLFQDLKDFGEDFEFYPTTKEIIFNLLKDIYKCTKVTTYGKFEGILDIGCGDGNVFRMMDELQREMREANKLILQFNRLLDRKTKYTTFGEGSEEQALDIMQKLKRFSFFKESEMKWAEDLPSDSLYLKEYEFGYFAGERFGIEKSNILIAKAEKVCNIIGTSFEDTPLINKPFHTIFCNPPYSEFGKWAKRIIEEANAMFVYLVIPERWRNNKILQNSIAKRGCQVESLGEFDFLQAKRKARAKVELVKLTFGKIETNSYDKVFCEELVTDPMKIFFDKTFKIKADKCKASEEFSKLGSENRAQKIESGLIDKGNLIDFLVNEYQTEMQHLLNSFKKIATLDFDLLKEIGVSKNTVMNNLQNKIEDLKTFYWREIFAKLKVLKEKLTSRESKRFEEMINRNKGIDFTANNIHYVISYALKNANSSLKTQIVDFFQDISGDASSRRNFKSNQKIYEEDKYRYNQSKPTHYTLDYRMVLTNLSKETLFQDLQIVANSLGFSCYGWIKFNTGFYSKQDNTGEKQFIYLDKDDEVLCEVKCFKNGNLHLRFNQQFVKALNIEASRLLGWIHNKSDIKAEFETEIEDEDIDAHFNSTPELNSSNTLLLK
jgi:hypothetical protein